MSFDSVKTAALKLTIAATIAAASLCTPGCRTQSSSRARRAVQPTEQVEQTGGLAGGTVERADGSQEEPSDDSRWSNWLDRLRPSAYIPLPLSKSSNAGAARPGSAATLSELEP